MGRLDGKVAIITGAGSGLGRAMAQRFVAEGASVLAADINEAGARETVAALEEDGAARAVAGRMDVSNEQDCADAVADAVARWGRLDVMVANAGIGMPLPIAELPREAWDAVLAVNLTGVFLCAKHAFRAMSQTGGGSIITMASIAGLHGAPGLGAYGPAKAGVVQLTQTLALEGARHNIRANALCPIWTQTPMVDAFVTLAGPSPDVMRARLVADIPLGRMGAPEDVAAAAVYFASDEAAFITGLAFPVDGGHMAGRGG